MVWNRLKRVASALCLLPLFLSGPAQAYEIPDGIDSTAVRIGVIAVDTYNGYFVSTPIYANEIDQDGIYMVPDGYIFMPGTTGEYVSTFAIAGALGGKTDAEIEQDTLAAAAEFKIGPGPFDTTNMAYVDMTPLHEAAVAAAPDDTQFLVGILVPAGHRLVVQDSFEAYVDGIIQAGGDLYGLQPDDAGLLEIVAMLPSFDPVANTGPTADAGADQTIDSGAAVTLDGSASADPDLGDTLTYAWTQTSGPEVTLSSATAASPGFTAPVVAANDPAAELVFSLVVTDDKGNASTADTVTITVEPSSNVAPTADAGTDRTVPHYGGLVTLDGSGSSDPDAGDTLTYTWTQTSGTVVKVIGAGTVTPKFSAPVLGANDPAVELVFSLVVTDDKGNASTADIVTITVEPPANTGPTADAGAAQTVASGASVTLDGSGSSDPDTGDTLSYAWTQTSGTTLSLTGATTAAPGFTAPEIGANDPAAELVFSLVVTDDKGNASDADTVTITVDPVANTGPTADAGADQTVDSGAAAVTLDGSASADPDAGDTLTYAWTQTSGPEVTLSSATAASPGFTAPVVAANDPAAELVFSLVVTDDRGNTSNADTVTITVDPVANTGPTADAGADQTVDSGAAVTLDGSASADPDAGDTLTYAWTQTSGPEVTLSSATAASPGFTAPEIGANDPAAELVFSLVVTDAKGNASDADTVTITVDPVANTGPTADAGADQTVDSGAAVTLDGSASADPDAGDTLTYAWTQTSGPEVTLSSATAASPGFTAPVVAANDPAAELVFSLVVTDDRGNTSNADTVTITVGAAAPT